MFSSATMAVESWILYSLGICFVVARLVCRRVTLASFAKYQLDDWIMFFTTIPLTGAVVCANETFIQHGPLDSPSDGTIPARKIHFAFEVVQITALWAVKACLLIMHWRLFENQNHRRLLKWSALLLLFSYVAIQVLLPIWCYPGDTDRNFQVSQSQRQTLRDFNIVTLTLDMVTTIITVLLPVPFIPTPRKALLAVLFVLGSLILTAGIAARAYSISQPSSPSYYHWSIAEIATLIYFANLPFLSWVTQPNHPTNARLRHASSHFSLREWPRSPKEPKKFNDTESRQRLGSNTTTTTLITSDAVGNWSEECLTPVTPVTPVYTLKPTDPPKELVDYCESRRPSTRSSDSSFHCQTAGHDSNLNNFSDSNNFSNNYNNHWQHPPSSRRWTNIDDLWSRQPISIRTTNHDLLPSSPISPMSRISNEPPSPLSTTFPFHRA